MMRAKKFLVLGLALAGLAAPSLADDLTGAQRLLCSSVEVSVCGGNGECESWLPWELNIPDFIYIDLKQNRLYTTPASGENRSTPIKHQERDGELLTIQGFEEGRAFSFLINVKTGRVTVAMAREDLGVSVFGSCTPAPSR